MSTIAEDRLIEVIKEIIKEYDGPGYLYDPITKARDLVEKLTGERP